MPTLGTVANLVNMKRKGLQMSTESGNNDEPDFGRLQRQHQRMKKNLKELEAELKDVKSERDRLREANKESKETKNKLNEAHRSEERLRDEKQALEDKVARTNDDMDRLAAENAQLIHQVQSLRDEERGLREALSEKGKQLEEKTMLVSMGEAVKEQVQQQREKIREQEQELERLRAHMIVSEKSRANQELVQNLVRDLIKVLSKYDPKVNDVASRLTGLLITNHGSREKSPEGSDADTSPSSSPEKLSPILSEKPEPHRPPNHSVLPGAKLERRLTHSRVQSQHRRPSISSRKSRPSEKGLRSRLFRGFSTHMYQNRVQRESQLPPAKPHPTGPLPAKPQASLQFWHEANNGDLSVRQPGARPHQMNRVQAAPSSERLRRKPPEIIVGGKSEMRNDRGTKCRDRPRTPHSRHPSVPPQSLKDPAADFEDAIKKLGLTKQQKVEKHALTALPRMNDLGLAKEHNRDSAIGEPRIDSDFSDDLREGEERRSVGWSDADINRDARRTVDSAIVLPLQVVNKASSKENSPPYKSDKTRQVDLKTTSCGQNSSVTNPMILCTATPRVQEDAQQQPMEDRSEDNEIKSNGEQLQPLTYRDVNNKGRDIPKVNGSGHQKLTQRPKTFGNFSRGGVPCDTALY